jgi:6-phosphogluconolactonase (cycloisomerase 2 family)
MYSSFNNQGYGLINYYNLDLTNRTATSIQMASVGNSAGGIAISNFGKVLIATEPNTNKLHSYLINSSTGALAEVDSKPTENYPHQALFFPDGQYALVINKTSKSVSTFLVDENSGVLKSIGTASVGSDPQDIVLSKVSN